MEQTRRRFGRIDALVNNAGIAVFKPMLDVTLEEWQRVLAVNLTGPFLMTQAVAPIMRDQGGGAIVNITSISGLRASTLRVAYGTSKAGLAHLTKQQAAELGEYGIRVNAVAPGPVDTAMAKAVHTPAIRADYHDHIPLNRYGLETELANAICFLCGDQAGYITGQVLAVDGGFDAAGVGLPTLRRNGATREPSRRQPISFATPRREGDTLENRSVSARSRPWAQPRFPRLSIVVSTLCDSRLSCTHRSAEAISASDNLAFIRR